MYVFWHNCKLFRATKIIIYTNMLHNVVNVRIIANFVANHISTNITHMALDYGVTMFLFYIYVA